MRSIAVRSRGAWSLVVSSFLGALLSATAAGATVVYVDDLNDCEGNSPCFTTIQLGVNNSSAAVDPPAEVRVFPGTYNESVDVALMGSAVAAGPGDLLIISEDVAQLALPSTTAAASVAVPAWLPAPLAAAVGQALERTPPGFVPQAAPHHAASVFALPVLIESPGGPAIFSSVAFPADLTLVGLDVHSATADGVNVTGTGLLEFNLGDASGNFGYGVVLVSSDTVGAAFSTFNGNGGSGASLESTGDDVLMINCVADANTLLGFEIRGSSTVQLFRVPGTLPGFPSAPTEFAARMNKLSGLFVRSDQAGVALVDLGVLIDLFAAPGILLDDNMQYGLLGEADETFTIIGARANGNDFSGISLVEVDETVTMYRVTANDNESSGIEILAAEALLLFSVTANGNLNGISAFSSGILEGDGVPMAGALLLATSSDGNDFNGVVLTTTGGPVLAYAISAIGNGITGIRLDVPNGSANQVKGGILCENGSGLSLVRNATVDAEGNWWGGVTGPFHATKNPSGLGNPVDDATSGGLSGDVDFTPWIDTVTATAVGMPARGVPSPVRFQFSGGNGTVFLGVPPELASFAGFGPGAIPPFTVSTDNGVLESPFGNGPSVMTFLTTPEGITEVSMTPQRLGPANLLLVGPCGLTSALAVDVGFPRTAPPLSGIGLAAAVASLLGVAFARRRSRAM